MTVTDRVSVAARSLPKLGSLSEFVGSAGLLFAATSAVRLTAPGGWLSDVNGVFHGRTLTIGCAIGGEVALFGLTRLGRLSGGQLNPAVTVLLWLRGKFGRLTALVYVTAQIAGSVVGLLLARLVWGGTVASRQLRYGLVQPRGGLSLGVTAAVECAMTCALLVTVVGVAAVRKSVAATTIFLVITAMIWLGGGWTGASFNPIRNLAPALLSGDYHFQAAYLFAPLVAGVLVGGALVLSARLQRQARALQTEGVGDGSDPVAATGQ